MTDELATSPFRGNRRRATLELRQWHAAVQRESAMEPWLPIVDAHHHLHGQPGDLHFYRREDLEQDLATGHNILGTVYVEAFSSGWRTDGPLELRSLGEIDLITGLSASPIDLEWGMCQLAAGIVSHVDLTIGDEVGRVLEAHAGAGQGRLRGIRQHATFHSGSIGRVVFNAPEGLLGQPRFRRGFSWLQRHGLSFDALVYHTQLGEVAALADAFPDTVIILNHVGIPIGIDHYATRKSEVIQAWRRDLRELARRPNVRVKVGGMGMPLFGLGFEHAEQPPRSQALALAWKPYIDESIDAFSPSRCMFESNFPVDKQSGGYAETWNAFKQVTQSLSTEERTDLFYRTACRSYRLPELEARCDQIVAKRPAGMQQRVAR